MIELRWLIDKRSDAIRVLQWRYQRTVLREENHETGYRLKRREEWSEWSAIPEVTAELPQKGEQS